MACQGRLGVNKRAHVLERMHIASRRGGAKESPPSPQLLPRAQTPPQLLPLI